MEPTKGNESMSKTIESNFGLYLIDHLQHAGFMQAEFAEAVGISPQYLSDIKSGSRAAPDTVLEGMATHLGCDRDEAYWIAGRITPDVEKLMLELGPESWRQLRADCTL